MEGARTRERTGEGESASRSGHSGRGSASRRAFLATGAAVSATALVGCLGGGSGSDATPTGGEPDPPWTTEDLVSQLGSNPTVQLYTGAVDKSSWKDLESVINDEFDTSLELKVFNSDGGTISQRFVQERQAGEDKADVLSYANDLNERIRQEGNSVADDYYLMDMDENFWFTDVLPDGRTLPWFVSSYNGGPSTATPLNGDVFEERGLDRPTTYNDLFDDQYEGLDTVLPSYLVATSIGWIVSHHAAQTDMSEKEWVTEIQNHLNFVGANSHTAGARMVAEGQAPLMFYNFPTTVANFVGDTPLVGHFVDPVQTRMWAGPLSINSEAPHPWAARFFVSAMLEEPVQRRILTDVPEMMPVRDLDYDTDGLSEFQQTLLSANLTRTTFDESRETAALGANARDWIEIG